MGESFWNIFCKKRGWEIWECSALRRDSSEWNLINVCKYLMEENEDEGARLFSVVPTDRTRDNGHKLKDMKSRLNTRDCFLTMRVVKHWQGLHREFLDSPSVEAVNSWLAPALSYVLWLTLLEWMGWTTRPQEVPSILNHSVVLCDSESVTNRVLDTLILVQEQEDHICNEKFSLQDEFST